MKVDNLYIKHNNESVSDILRVARMSKYKVKGIYKNHRITAWYKNKPVGMILFDIKNKNLKFNLKEHIVINGLYIDKFYRRQGIANELRKILRSFALWYCIDFILPILTCTREGYSNIPAMKKLNKNFGFKKVKQDVIDNKIRTWYLFK